MFRAAVNTSENRTPGQRGREGAPRVLTTAGWGWDRDGSDDTLSFLLKISMNGCTPSVTAISEKLPKPGSWSQVQGTFKAQDTVFIARGRSVFLSLGVIWRAEGGHCRAGPRICLQGWSVSSGHVILNLQFYHKQLGWVFLFTEAQRGCAWDLRLHSQPAGESWEASRVGLGILRSKHSRTAATYSDQAGLSASPAEPRVPRQMPRFIEVSFSRL